jgi:hypothetical protein
MKKPVAKKTAKTVAKKSAKVAKSTKIVAAKTNKTVATQADDKAEGSPNETRSEPHNGEADCFNVAQGRRHYSRFPRRRRFRHSVDGSR